MTKKEADAALEWLKNKGLSDVVDIRRDHSTPNWAIRILHYAVDKTTGKVTDHDYLKFLVPETNEQA